MTIARPTATSATVLEMVNSVKIRPARSVRKRAKATRLMFTAFSISSMPSRLPTALRRGDTPTRPMAKTSAARVRYAASGISGVTAREVERAEQGDHQQDGEELEGHHEGAHQRPSQERGELAGPRLARSARRHLHQEPHHADEDGGAQHRAVDQVATGLADRLADQALGQHDRED